MQAPFPARHTEAASSWEKSRGNTSLLALKMELARVLRVICPVACSLSRELVQSSQSIHSIHCTPPERPPASWARDTASTASACSHDGWLQPLCFLRGYRRSSKRCYCCQQQGASISGLVLEKTKSKDSLKAVL